MRALPLALFLAVATWIVGCATPDIVGTQPRGGDVAGDDDDDPAPAKKKKSTTAGTPVGATDVPTGTGTTPTTADPVVTTPTTTTTTPTTDTTNPTTPITTPTPTPAPEPTPAPTVTHTTFTTTANLNLREGPSTTDAIILTMPNGSEVEAIEETPTANWYHISFQGQEGWASGSYLQEN